ncbi:MAG: YaeQ family protein [Leptospirales bacterium]
MALKSTIHKVNLQITNTDCDYYELHKITIARHPSETDERLMIRLLAFALNASSTLTFAGDISEADQPAIWEKSRSGLIETWIEIGQPDEKIIRKACSNARNVILYCFNLRRSQTWWNTIQTKLERFKNLEVWLIPDGDEEKLEKLVQKNMQIDCRIQDQEVWISDKDVEIHLTPQVLKVATSK